jgi:hypothetical protein
MLPRITTFLPKNFIVISILILLVVVIALAITTLIFIRNNKSPITVPVNAHPNDLILTHCSYKTKTMIYRSECGTLVVLENHFNPASRMIALQVKRIHAVSKSPLEPIFYLPGGPGISNINIMPLDGLLKNHDVVMVGYRGVDGLSILDCPEFSKAVLGDGSNVLSGESLAIMTHAIRD